MSTRAELYDVAVVGAGPAGSATAIHLARAGLRVALFDSATFPRDKPCAEYLSPGAEPLLRDLGVLEEIESRAPSHLKGFRVYAPAGGMFQGDFAGTRRHDGVPLYQHGLTVPRLTLDATLAHAAQAAGAVLHEGCRVARVERVESTGGAPGWRLLANDGRTLDQAHLLVAADGVHSTIARRLGLHRPGRMRKIALVAHLRGITSLSEYGEVHVAGRRYVGLAPLEPASRGDLCNVALVVDETRDGRQVAGRTEPFFFETLASFPHLRDRIAQTAVSRRILTTSRLSVSARRVVDAGLILVGDAAGYYDPFTGEGIYQALRSAELAAGVIAPALAAGNVSAAALAPYAARLREALRGKRQVESIIQSAVQLPPLMDRIADVLAKRKWMADTIVAVTGDYLPPSAVLNPAYLLRLIG